MRRIGEVIKVRPGCLQQYIDYHSNPWPEVDEMIYKCNIRNYTIYQYGEYLFASYEYIGDDYEKDMEMMAQDPITCKWWSVVKPLQEPLPDRKDGEWWKGMEEVYHLDEAKFLK